MRFKVNTPPVIHQTLDGEVIVVDLDSGTYYSIAGTGAEIWAAIEAGATTEEAILSMQRRYGDDEEVGAAVSRFVEELVAGDLIVTAAERTEAPALPEEPAGERFVPPTLTRYTDMQELLMLDPIHEVDENGWPNSLDRTGQAGEG
ncbi:MAG TPA: PqqD family protein [Gaiellaceae bacterium]|jgi:hypothetical protein|nr:PqqD family protein [Gaiellaceae bacterium]